MQPAFLSGQLAQERGARPPAPGMKVTTFVLSALCVFGVACLCGNALAPVGFALTPVA